MGKTVTALRKLHFLHYTARGSPIHREGSNTGRLKSANRPQEICGDVCSYGHVCFWLQRKKTGRTSFVGACVLMMLVNLYIFRLLSAACKYIASVCCLSRKGTTHLRIECHASM